MVTPIEEGNKVRAEITTILLKEQIRYFKEHNRWPKEFEDDHLEMTRPEDDAKIGDNSAEEEEEEEEDSDSDLEDDLVPNTNRVYFDESSEEEDEKDEEDSEDEEEEKVEDKPDQQDQKKKETLDT